MTNNQQLLFADGLTNALRLTRPWRALWIAADQPQSGQGSMDRPLRITSAAEFDALMKTLPEGWTLHFYPGTYYTEGNCSSQKPGPGNHYWRLKSGQRLFGLDKLKTKITMVPSPAKLATPNQRWVIFGTDAYNEIFHDIQIANLTLDVNMRDMPSTVVGSAIHILGSKHRARKVRIVDWGCGEDTTGECFAAAFGGGHPDLGPDSVGHDSMWIDCEAVDQFPKQGTGGSTAFICGMCGESSANGRQFYGLGNGMKGCRVVGNNPQQLCHAYSVGGIDNFVEDCVAENLRFAHYTDTWNSRSIRLEGNRFTNVLCGSSLQMGGSMIRDNFGVPGQATHQGNQLVIQTTKDNDLKPGEWIEIKAGVHPKIRLFAKVTQNDGLGEFTADLMQKAPTEFTACRWGRVWNRGLVSVEDNEIEVAENDGKLFHAITMQAGSIPMEITTFEKIRLNRNVIKHAKNAPKKWPPIAIDHARQVEMIGNRLPEGPECVIKAHQSFVQDNRVVKP